MAYAVPKLLPPMTYPRPLKVASVRVRYSNCQTCYCQPTDLAQQKYMVLVLEKCRVCSAKSYGFVQQKVWFCSAKVLFRWKRHGNGLLTAGMMPIGKQWGDKCEKRTFQNSRLRIAKRIRWKYRILRGGNVNIFDTFGLNLLKLSANLSSASSF